MGRALPYVMTGPKRTCLAVLVGAAVALGQPLEPEAPVPAPVALPHFGVHLEAGVPDGLGAAFVVSPVGFLRLEAGWLNNGVGSGARVGATLLAFPSSVVRPLFGVDAGAVLGGLGEWLPDLIPNSVVRDAVRGATVKFVNAQVGFELGSPNVALTVRVGGSYVDLALAEQALAPGSAASGSVSGFVLRAFLPSARLGLLVCFG